MFGDDAAALLAGFYEVDQVKSCTKFEAAGLNFALPSFVHFDLDGHCANNLMRQRGSARLIPRSSCRSRTAGFTRRGCAKHACTALYTNNSLDGFYNCSTFLQTSVHFLRLVRATAEGVRRYMDAPTGNMFQILRQRTCAARLATASAIGTLPTKRRCARARGEATRSTNHCRIDMARRHRGETKALGPQTVRRYLGPIPGVFSRPLWRQRSRMGPHSRVQQSIMLSRA